MKKNLFFILFSSLFLFLIPDLKAQEIYLTQNQVFANIISVEEWISSDYSGVYEAGCPAMPVGDGTEADGYSETLNIEQNGSNLNAFTSFSYLEQEENSSLTNPIISGNNLSSEELSGEFVLLKCKTKKNKTIKTKGLLKILSGYYIFYQLQK